MASPPVHEPVFDPGFRRILDDVVRRTAGLAGRRIRDDVARARRRRIAASGVDFAGHRPYAVGDDLRRVDWNLYARSRELHVTQREEEETRGLTVVVDTSASMTAGIGQPRLTAALRLAAVVGAVGLHRLDSVVLRTSSAEAVRLVAAGSGAVGELLARLEAVAAAAADPEPPDAVVRAVCEPAPGRSQLSWQGSLVWISDFAPVERFARPLRRLAAARRRGRRRAPVLALVPMLPEDRLPAVGGTVALRCPESGDELRVRVDEPLRRAVADELARLERAQAVLFRSCGVRHARFEVPEPGRPATVRDWLPGEWAGWI